MIERKTDINAKNQDDDTPLHYAAAGDQPKMIELLIKAGANINQQNKFLATPLIYCGYNGNTLIDLTNDNKNFNKSNYHEWSGNQWKLQKKNWIHMKNEITKSFLMLYKPKQNIQYKILSIWYTGREKIALMLLEAGKFSEICLTTVFICWSKSDSLLNLYHTGANFTIKDNENRNALQSAANGGLERIVKILIEKGADVHDEGYNKRTALHEAADYGMFHWIKESLLFTDKCQFSSQFYSKNWIPFTWFI